jgi:hypothetical protein
MENQNYSIIKSAQNYGLPLGLLLIAITLFAYLLDIDKEKWLGIVVFIIIELAIIYCIYDVRKSNNISISFAEAFKPAIYMCLIAILISSVYFFIHVNFIDIHYVETMSEIQRNEMIQNGMSETSITKAMSVASSFNSPIVITGIAFLVNLIVATILSAISATIMKRD